MNEIAKDVLKKKKFDKRKIEMYDEIVCLFFKNSYKSLLE